MSINNTTPDGLTCWSYDFVNVTCTTPTPAMIDFLNITSLPTYFQAYCVNPPDDSCNAFGYCPNPDISSPAVRISMYISTICLSIVMLYSEEDKVVEAFYAQLLSMYSLVVSAVIAIAKHQLTRLHAVAALSLAGSPLMFYLTLYAFKEVLGRETRITHVFTDLKGTKLTLVLLLFPLWLAVLIFLALPRHIWQFQQAACDHLLKDHVVWNVFVISAISFIPRTQKIVFASLSGLLLLSWILAIVLQRDEIQRLQDEEGKFVLAATWRAVIKAYPTIRFCTIILFPFILWIAIVESGSHFTNEKFQPTYGQLLTIFIAVPPLCQCLPKLFNIWPWFTQLSWVVFLHSRFSHLYSPARVEEREMYEFEHQETGGKPDDGDQGYLTE